MAKYDERFTLSVVQSYESGGQVFKALAQRHGLDHATVRHWVKSYQQHGLKDLRRKFSHCGAEFKLSVLQRIQQKELSARQAIVLFDIRGGAGVIRAWERLYQKGAYRPCIPSLEDAAKWYLLNPPPRSQRSQPPVVRRRRSPSRHIGHDAGISGHDQRNTPVMELFNGEIISYAMQRRPQFSLISNMLKKALAKLNDSDAPLLHSDQGWQGTFNSSPPVA